MPSDMQKQDRGSKDRNCTRRQVLHAGGAALTAGLAGSSAGCLSLLPPVGQQIRYGRVDVPAPTSSQPVYRKWMPAYSEVSDLQYVEEEMNWHYVTPGNLGREQLGGSFRIGIDIIQSYATYFGTDLGTHDHAVGLGSLGAVIESNVDKPQVTSTMESTNFESAGRHRGYELFDRTDTARLVAVSENAVVQATGEQRRPKAEAIIDTGEGHITRKHEVDESFERFSEWVGAYPTVMEGFGAFVYESEPEESAMVYTFDEEAGYFIHKNRYPDGETPSEGEVKRSLSEEMTRAMQAWSVDVEVDEPQVSVQMRVEKDRFGSDFSQETLPLVTWGVDHGEQTVTVRHEAGDSVLTERLEIKPEAALQNPPSEGAVLEPGDRLTFDSHRLPTDADSPRSEIRLLYQYPSGDSAMLFSHDVDENDTTT